MELRKLWHYEDGESGARPQKLPLSRSEWWRPGKSEWFSFLFSTNSEFLLQTTMYTHTSLVSLLDEGPSLEGPPMALESWFQLPFWRFTAWDQTSL